MVFCHVCGEDCGEARFCHGCGNRLKKLSVDASALINTTNKTSKKNSNVGDDDEDDAVFSQNHRSTQKMKGKNEFNNNNSNSHHSHHHHISNNNNNNKKSSKPLPSKKIQKVTFNRDDDDVYDDGDGDEFAYNDPINLRKNNRSSNKNAIDNRNNNNNNKERISFVGPSDHSPSSSQYYSKDSVLSPRLATRSSAPQKKTLSIVQAVKSKYGGVSPQTRVRSTTTTKPEPSKPSPAPVRSNQPRPLTKAQIAAGFRPNGSGSSSVVSERSRSIRKSTSPMQPRKKGVLERLNSGSPAPMDIKDRLTWNK